MASDDVCESDDLDPALVRSIAHSIRVSRTGEDFDVVARRFEPESRRNREKLQRQVEALIQSDPTV